MDTSADTCPVHTCPEAWQIEVRGYVLDVEGQDVTVVLESGTGVTHGERRRLPLALFQPLGLNAQGERFIYHSRMMGGKACDSLIPDPDALSRNNAEIEALIRQKSAEALAELTAYLQE
jgi:hypothetical protein